MVRVQERGKVSFAAKYRELYGGEQSELDALYFGAPVRIYQATSKRWEGPFKFVSKDEETVCVEITQCRKLFRAYAGKMDTSSFHKERGASEALTLDHALYAANGSEDIVQVTEDGAGKFKEFRMKELSGLKEAGVFHFVTKIRVPRGSLIYGTRFVDLVKKQLEVQKLSNLD